MTGPEIQLQTDTDWRSDWREFPWWLVAIFGFLRPHGDPDYRVAQL